ncbi:hypothetical protein GCM10027416_22150 [Okibacterium endophyticum]
MNEREIDLSDDEGYDQDIVQQDTLADLGVEQDTPDQSTIEDHRHIDRSPTSDDREGEEEP